MILCLLPAAASVLTQPHISVHAVKEGLSICANSVIPSLFPYFFLTNFCLSQGIIQAFGRRLKPCLSKVFHLSSAGCAALTLGVFAGFPIGGQTAIRLYEEGSISKKEAEHLLMFCSNAGPAFAVGVIGEGIFNHWYIGLGLWLIHIFSAATIGFLFRKETTAEQAVSSETGAPTLYTSIANAVIDSSFSLFRVCGFLLLFCIMIAHLLHLLPSLLHRSGAAAVLAGILELTNGIQMLKNLDPVLSLPGSAALLSWNGFCVHMQVLSAIGQKPLSVKPYFISKLLQSFLSTLIVLAAAPLFSLPSSYKTILVSPILFAALVLVAMIAKTSTGNTDRNHI